MLSEDERERIKHINEILEKEIKTKEEEITKIRKTKGDLSKFLYGKEAFKCPLGKSNYDALCPKCTYAIPFITEGWKCGGSSEAINYYSFPYDMNKDIGDKVKFKTKGCKEWTKKNRTTACGCGGIHWCECGFNAEYCHNTNNKCPYCGRELQDKKYKPLITFGLDTIPINTK